MEEFGFKARVELLGLFPCNVLVAGFSGSDTSNISSIAGTKAESGSSGVHCGVECKSASSANLVIADFSVRSFELEAGDNVPETGPETLVGDEVTYCK